MDWVYHLKKSFFTLLVCSLALGSMVQAQDTYYLTLDECLQYAEENATAVKNAQIDVQKAAAQVGLVRADGLPQVNGSAEMNYNYKIQQSILPAEFGAFGNPDAGSAPPSDDPIVIPFGVAYTGNAAINVRQLLFDGVFFLGLKAANVYQDLSKKSLVQTEIETKASVAKAYYAVLVNRERLELLKANVNRLTILEAETKAMYENGFAEKIDVDRITVNLNNVKVELQRLERGVELANAMLKFQMGMPLTDKLELAQGLATFNLEGYLPQAPNAFSPENRIEYSLIDTQEQLDRLNVRQYRSGYFPKLYLNNTLGWNTGGNEFSQLTDWFGFGFVGLSIEIPIFDGLRKKYQIEDAKLSLQQTMNNREQLEQSITMEVDRTYKELLNSLAALEAQRDNRELAEEVYRVTKVKYQEGVGTNLELVEAENAFKEAETNYFSALYDALVFKVDYQKAMGMFGVE